MAYTYANRADNVYLIDTRMFGFEKFQSSYIIKGKEIALIDTGVPPSLDLVRAAIKGHGFAIEDISYIFVTHCEHPDHSGNVGAFLQENSRAKVYINPIGAEYLTDPSIEAARRKEILLPKMAARFGTMIPVPESRIEYLNDGDEVDLGDGEKLKVYFTPGHQPSGLVIHAKKNNGLFINDLCGLYLADVNISLIFTPDKANVEQAMKSLNRIKGIPVDRLFLGHFGICDKPKQVIENALNHMQQLMDIGERCMKEGKPENIEKEVYARIAKEADKVRKPRGEDLYQYLSKELLPNLARGFSRYYTEQHKK